MSELSKILKTPVWILTMILTVSSNLFKEKNQENNKLEVRIQKEVKLAIDTTTWLGNTHTEVETFQSCQRADNAWY